MEQYLENISKNTSPKRSEYIVFRGNDSKIKTEFLPVVESKNCEIAVVGLSTYYSYPNINEKNNEIIIVNYNKDKTKAKRTVIKFPKGCYELEDINNVLTEKMKWKDEPKVKITADSITLRTLLFIDELWQVIFEKNSLASVLGFKNQMYYGKETYISERIANILSVNNILVQCDVISGSSINGKSAPVIFNYSPVVSAGNKIVAEPVIPIYLPVTVEFINQMSVWITDQDNELLDLQGEDLVVTFHLRTR